MARVGRRVRAHRLLAGRRSQPDRRRPRDFSDTDRLVAPAAAHGSRCSRSWPTRPRGPRSPVAPGLAAGNAGDYAPSCDGSVARYGPAGSFWASTPSCRCRPLREWQIWNEPHLRLLLGHERPRPNAWAPRVRRSSAGASRTIRRARPRRDRRARRRSPTSPGGTWPAPHAGARGSFDVAAINFFTGRARRPEGRSLLPRTPCAAPTSRRKPIWVTEATLPGGQGPGAARRSSTGSASWYTTRRGMATRLRELYSLGRANASRRLGPEAHLLVHVGVELRERRPVRLLRASSVTAGGTMTVACRRSARLPPGSARRN